MGLDEFDRTWLLRAAALAGRGWGRVHQPRNRDDSPNPLVGCVLTRNGKVVGEGWHQDYGGPHAEVNAIRAAGEAARGATAFVSLEPCSHHGKTPPCTEALVEAGVVRVVFGAADPGVETGGGGDLLMRAGIEVLGPASDVQMFHDVDPAFFHTARHQKPYVALKLAVSLDGRIAARVGERTTLTGDEANREVHRLRRGFDSVMVGGETARIDDPVLTVRHGPPPQTPPTRIVVDPRGILAPEAALLRGVSEAPVLIFATEAADAERLSMLRDAGASVEIVEHVEGGANLKEMLDRCWNLGIRSVLCEGGARLATALTHEGLARRLYLFKAPMTFGSEGVAAFPGGESNAESFGWVRAGEPHPFGPDVLLTYDREI